MAAALEVPRNYLSKTLHQLARAGILESARGPRGGFTLAVPSEFLALRDVVAPFAPLGERQCLLGRPRCLDGEPCAAHHRWKFVAEEIEAFFASTTIADLMARERASGSAPGHAPLSPPPVAIAVAGRTTRRRR